MLYLGLFCSHIYIHKETLVLKAFSLLPGKIFSNMALSADYILISCIAFTFSTKDKRIRVCQKREFAPAKERLHGISPVLKLESSRK